MTGSSSPSRRRSELSYLPISRYYNDNYGRLSPSTREQVRVAAGSAIAVAVVLGGSTLLRSRADWSLDLPVNAIAVTFAVVMLISYGIGVGLKAHHVIIWGALLVAGALPVWNGADPSNIGIVLAGVAVIVSGVSTTGSSFRPSARPTRWTTRTAMLQPEEDLVLDRLIHEPGRLAILTVLSSVRDADFVFLQRATGLTKGNLSSHLTKLEDAGLVTIEKRFVRKKPNTSVALTGRASAASPTTGISWSA